MNRPYVTALAGVGLAPMLVPLGLEEDHLRALYQQSHGLLLPGGADIDPARYGEERMPECGAIDQELDRAELAMARWALEEGKPILATCRGQQTLNVAAGGTLYQDIPSQVPGALTHRVDDKPRDHLAHQVRVESHSYLLECLGESKLWVNSLHHQAVKEPSPELRVVAQASDGIVEGMEHRSHPWAISVQFHPEELYQKHAPSLRLFQAFAEAVAVYARHR